MPKCRNTECDHEVNDTDAMAGACSENCYKQLFQPKMHNYATQGLRYNKDKARITLIPFEVIKALANHYTVGAKKYEDNNWRKGLKYSDTMDCAMRHIIAFQTGEDTDLETGSHHLDAAIWNLVALRFFEMYPERYKQFDDRWKLGPFEDVLPPDILRKEVWKADRVFVPTPENRALLAEFIRSTTGRTDDKFIDQMTQYLYQTVHGAEVEYE